MKILAHLTFTRTELPLLNPLSTDAQSLLPSSIKNSRRGHVCSSPPVDVTALNLFQLFFPLVNFYSPVPTAQFDPFNYGER